MEISTVVINTPVINNKLDTTIHKTRTLIGIVLTFLKTKSHEVNIPKQIPVTKYSMIQDKHTRNENSLLSRISISFPLIIIDHKSAMQ